MFIPACMSNGKLTNFYILEQNSETLGTYNNLLPETHVDTT